MSCVDLIERSIPMPSEKAAVRYAVLLAGCTRYTSEPWRFGYRVKCWYGESVTMLYLFLVGRGDYVELSALLFCSGDLPRLAICRDFLER